MIGLLVLLVVVGVVVYFLNAVVPIDPRFKLAINCIIGLCLLLYILQYFGVWDGGFQTRYHSGRTGL